LVVLPDIGVTCSTTDGESSSVVNGFRACSFTISDADEFWACDDAGGRDGARFAHANLTIDVAMGRFGVCAHSAGSICASTFFVSLAKSSKLFAGISESIGHSTTVFVACNAPAHTNVRLRDARTTYLQIHVAACTTFCTQQF
jgi:hypothetical protein